MNREQAFDEKLDAIIWELTDPSGWDLIGITQAQADALSEQLRTEQAEAKQAIMQLIAQAKIDELTPLLSNVPLNSLSYEYLITRLDNLNLRSKL